MRGRTKEAEELWKQVSLYSFSINYYGHLDFLLLHYHVLRNGL